MFDKNQISKENLYLANLQREKRMKDQLDEMEREKIAMEKLRYQMEQDKINQLEKKNQIRQNQYEEYNNYLRQKYSTPPQYREKLNIKLGGEQRNIIKKDYNEEMKNLCLNPTNEKNVYPTTPTINYSEMGRNYQKGYSHGYNIITGEVYSNPISNQNSNNKNKYRGEEENLNERKANKPNYNINVSQEEYEEFLKFKEYRRRRELELREQEKYNNYEDNVNEKEVRQNENGPYEQYENGPNYNQPNKDSYPGQYQNDMQEADYQRQQFSNNQIQEKDIDYQNNRANFYANNINKNPKENFHYEKEKISPQPQSNKNIEEPKENNYQQNKFYSEYQKEFIQNQQREREKYNNNYMQNYPPNYPQEEYNQVPPQNYNEENNFRRGEQYYPEPPQTNQMKDMYNYELQNQSRGREQENPPYPYPYQYPPNENDMNNIPGENEKEMMMRKDNNDEIEFRNKIPLVGNNRQMMPNNEKMDNRQMPQQGNDDKDLDREKYMQYLLSKANENKDKIEPGPNMNYDNYYIRREQNYPKEYEQQMMNNYPQQEMQNNNYYPNPNQIQENDYYNNNQKEPIQYNNFMSPNDYQNQLQRGRERLEDENGKKYLSYQQQIERIKKLENEEGQNNNNIDNFTNKNAKEIISEFNENKRKNLYSEDHIFHTKQPPQAPPKYNDEPLSSKERKQIQRDYAKYLDWQIQEKNQRNERTPFNKKYNPILDNTENNQYGEGQNPYQQMREKNSSFKDIQPNPYSNKNYDINSKSNLGYNPITNPDNNYNFH